MAKPTGLGMILDGADAVEFWKNEEDATFTDEQMEFYSETAAAHPRSKLRGIRGAAA